MKNKSKEIEKHKMMFSKYDAATEGEEEGEDEAEESKIMQEPDLLYLLHFGPISWLHLRQCDCSFYFSGNQLSSAGLSAD